MQLIYSMLNGALILAGASQAAMINQDVAATSAPTLDELSPISTTSRTEFGVAPVNIQQESQELKRNAEAEPAAQASNGFTVVNTFTSIAATSTSSSSQSSTAASTTSAAPTSIVVFTAGGGIYTATAISSIVQVAGYQLQVGGAAALVGGARVSAASSGLVENGLTLKYSALTAASSTTTDTGSATETDTGSPSSTAASSTTSPAASQNSASAAGSTSKPGAAAALQTPGPMQALIMLGGAMMMFA